MDGSLVCTTLTEHLKMMRFLFLCLLLLLPAAAADSNDIEGSADDDLDDEDLGRRSFVPSMSDPNPDKTNDKVTLIVIIVAATVLTLSVAAIVGVMLVRRRMQNRQQGVYSVPTEQDQKGAI